MLFDLRRPEFSPMRLHGRKRAGFVSLYEPRIADHVGSENGRKTAFQQSLPVKEE
jgi:hypothetical protein